MAGLNINKVLDLAIVGAIGVIGFKLIEKLSPTKTTEGSTSVEDGWLSGDEKGVLEKIGEFFLGKKVSAQEEFNKTQDTSSSPFLPGYKPSSEPTATIYDKGFIDAVMSDLPAALSGTVNSIYWTLTQQHLDWTHEELASQALKDAGIPLNLYTGNTGQVGGSTFVETLVTLPIADPGYTESYAGGGGQLGSIIAKATELEPTLYSGTSFPTGPKAIFGEGASHPENYIWSALDRAYIRSDLWDYSHSQQLWG